MGENGTQHLKKDRGGSLELMHCHWKAFVGHRCQILKNHLENHPRNKEATPNCSLPYFVTWVVHYHVL